MEFDRGKEEKGTGYETERRRRPYRCSETIQRRVEVWKALSGCEWKNNKAWVELYAGRGKEEVF